MIAKDGGKSVTATTSWIELKMTPETVKDILIAVARRAEATDERMERIGKKNR